MQTLCFFNNKGGVGKTTLATNIASYFATHLKRRVLIVDLDPQCNTTQLILPTTKHEAYFNDPHGSLTVMKVVQPIRLGDTDIDVDIPILKSTENSFKVDLIPGHPSLSLFEDTLSGAWLSMKGTEPGGLRKSLWVRQLTSLLSADYDIIMVDVGPSFGALNRTVLLGTDFFLSPLGCDLFSIIGIENIGTWLRGNKKILDKAVKEISDTFGSDSLSNFGIALDELDFAKYVGYTVLQYITKSKGGERRPTEAFERFRRRIPEAVEKSLKNEVAGGLGISQLDLGDVPNMYSIVPLAQYAQKPVHLLTSSDGLAGAAFAQHYGYVEFIASLSKRLLENLDAVK